MAKRSLKDLEKALEDARKENNEQLVLELESAIEKIKVDEVSKDTDKKQPGPQLKVDNIRVEVIESIPKFFYAGKYLSLKLGEKKVVSENLKNILIKRGAVRVI